VSTGHPKKCYSLSGWGKVGEELLNAGFAVAYLGGPGDHTPDVPGAIDWVGKLALDETMAAVRLSAVHLAGDTGTGHIAAAYGVPAVSVFGWSRPNRFRPLTDRGIVLDAGRNMDGVTPEQIVAAASHLAERQPRAIPG
jgi:ADP-heptose:LPS heptosyltransferase